MESTTKIIIQPNNPQTYFFSTQFLKPNNTTIFNKQQINLTKDKNMFLAIVACILGKAS